VRFAGYAAFRLCLARLLRLLSRAPRARIRSSSVITDQRGARRAPSRRTSPACSLSLSKTRTWPESAFARLASALVVEPGLSARSLISFSGTTPDFGFAVVLVLRLIVRSLAGPDVAAPCNASRARYSWACSVVSSRTRVSMLLTSSSIVFVTGRHATGGRGEFGRAIAASCKRGFTPELASGLSLMRSSARLWPPDESN
jgi:hypothetical protein